MTALASAPPRAFATAVPVAAVADGRRMVFDEVYAEHFAFVWRSALSLGTPRAHVDDVVQDAFVIVHRRLAAFEGRSSLKTWLFGILVNVVRAHRRSAGASWRAHGQADPEVVADPTASPDDLAARAEAARVVDRLLDALDDDKRAVFVLAELERMSVPDIAQALAIPVNTAYSRLRLARQEFTAAAARHRARDAWRTR